MVHEVERLLTAGIGITARAIEQTPEAKDLTLLQWRVLMVAAEPTGIRIGAARGAPWRQRPIGKSARSTGRSTRARDRDARRRRSTRDDGRCVSAGPTARRCRRAGSTRADPTRARRHPARARCVASSGARRSRDRQPPRRWIGGARMIVDGIEFRSSPMELRHASTERPVFVLVPERSLLAIDGVGRRGADDFRRATTVLRAAADVLRASMPHDPLRLEAHQIIEISWPIDGDAHRRQGARSPRRSPSALATDDRVARTGERGRSSAGHRRGRPDRWSGRPARPRDPTRGGARRADPGDRRSGPNGDDPEAVAARARSGVPAVR